MRITSEVIHTDKGVAKVIAKGNGKQRTVAYNHEVSHERNIGEAAGTLALVLIEGATARKVAARTAKHTQKGQRHVFTLGE